jgi:hypothetical protein
MAGDELLYNLTLLSESDGRGGIARSVIIQLRPDLVEHGTVIKVISGSRKFRVVEERPSDLTEGMFGERGAA